MSAHCSLKQKNIKLNLNKRFVSIIESILMKECKLNAKAITLNFRDIDYSADNGGFHPVEIRLIFENNYWYFDYLTDFSYMGSYYPELEKEIDISWTYRYFWHYLMGDISIEEGEDFFELWQNNFIEYYHMEIYTLEINID